MPPKKPKPARASARSPETHYEPAISADFLQQIANCLAYLVVKSDQLKDKPKNELIPLLAKFGYDKNAIAAILQTTSENVRVTLSEAKSAELNAKRVGRKSPAPAAHTETGPSD